MAIANKVLDNDIEYPISVKDYDPSMRNLIHIRAKEQKGEFYIEEQVDNDNVDFAFRWSQTEEGSDYWIKVYTGEITTLPERKIKKLKFKSHGR